MTLASKHWWRETGLRIMGGLMILTGLLLAFLSQIMLPGHAGLGLITGLAIAGLGAGLVAVGNL